MNFPSAVYDSDVGIERLELQNQTSLFSPNRRAASSAYLRVEMASSAEGGLSGGSGNFMTLLIGGCAAVVIIAAMTG